MKSYKSPKTEVKESPIRGKGLFAREYIKKGEIVAIKSGYIINLEKYTKLDKAPRHYCLQLDDNFFLGPRTEEEIEENAIYINHSCDPNVGFDGQITYVAMRDIKPGEELCHDYAMLFTKRGIDLKCNCGSKNCRNVITDNDWKIKELQDKYRNHFAYYILKKIDLEKRAKRN